MTANILPQIVLALVDNLPGEHTLHMAALLEKEESLNWGSLQYKLASVAPQVETQDRVRAFIQQWRHLPDPPTPREMALLFRTVAFALQTERARQKIDLIWTGPKSAHTNLRRTDQALIELINSAHSRIIIVSFAVYKAGNIRLALLKAAQREVEIKIILESPESGEGKIAYNTIAALGPELRLHSRIYIWPTAKRAVTADGKTGALHAKAASADGKRLYISSANLTDYAMNVNMEMGVVIEDEDLPRKFEELVEELIVNGDLSEIAPQ